MTAPPISRGVVVTFINIVEFNEMNTRTYVESKSCEVNNHNRCDFLHVDVKKETYVGVRGLVSGQRSARLHPLFSYAWFMAGAMNPAVKHFLFAFLLIARDMAIAINPVGNGIVVFLIYRSREGRGRTHRAAKRSCQLQGSSVLLFNLWPLRACLIFMIGHIKFGM